MTRAHLRAIFVPSIVLIAGALALAAIHRARDSGNSPRPDRPALMLLTSLPLIFDEGFGLTGGGSPALAALRTRYRVIPISVTSAAELRRGRLLLMAHAPAQTAENLVALDHWVRRGGRVMLLADPLLEWPSKLPLGDPLRPSPMFADTGLLAHWGVKLAAPDRRGLAERSLDGRRILTVSPGRLSGSCEISNDGFVADCAVGKGRAIIVADADFLDVAALPAGSGRNLEALVGKLANLESK